MALTGMPNNPMNFTENQHGNAILEKLRSQKEQGRFCDIVLCVQGRQFRAHRNVLASCSPYFDSILKMHKIVKEQLTITCQNSDVFQCLLNYMYTGSVVIDKHNVCELLKLANHFLVAKLKSYCAEYLDRYLDVTNCLSVKEMAEKYSMPALSKHATLYVQIHIHDVMFQDEILNHPLPKIEAFLSDKSWTVPQNSLLKFITRWIGHDVPARERDMRTLLTFIDWNSVDGASVMDHIDRESLYSSSEICLYFILQSLVENNLLFPKYQHVYQTLQEKFTQAGQTIDSDSFLNMAVSTAIEGLQEASSDLGDDSDGTQHHPGKPEVHKESSSEKLDGSWKSSMSLSDTCSKTSLENIDTGRSDEQQHTKHSMQTQTDEKDTEINGEGNNLKLVPGSSLEKDSTQHTCKPKIKRRQCIKLSKLGRASTARLAMIKRIRKRKLIVRSLVKKKKVVSCKGLQQDDSEDNYNEDEANILDHNRSRRGVRCHMCSYVAKDSSLLEQHVAHTHSKDVTYKCGICGFICHWNKEYYTHMKSHFHGPPFRCDSCEYSCDRIQLLLTHRLQHSDERPFKCEECDYRCRTRSNLTVHMRCHTGEKSFKCETCGRAFAMKSTLEQHLLSHGNDRPYLCDMCGFSTKYLSHLMAHKRIHTDVYRCSYPHCKYSTPKKSQLGSHMRTHMGIRPHTCTVCGRGFLEKSHLVRHERIHLNEKPFKCQQCDYASSRRDKLKEHFQRHHSENASAKVPYKPRPPRKIKYEQMYIGGRGDPQQQEIDLMMQGSQLSSHPPTTSQGHISVPPPSVYSFEPHHSNQDFHQMAPPSMSRSQSKSEELHVPQASSTPSSSHTVVPGVIPRSLSSKIDTLQGLDSSSQLPHHVLPPLPRAQHQVPPTMMLDPRFHANPGPYGSALEPPRSLPVSMAMSPAIQSQPVGQHPGEYPGLQPCMPLF